MGRTFTRSRCNFSNRHVTITRASNRRQFTLRSSALQLAAMPKLSDLSRNVRLTYMRAINITRYSTIWRWRTVLLIWRTVVGNNIGSKFTHSSRRIADSSKKTVCTWDQYIKVTWRVNRSLLLKYLFHKLRICNKIVSYHHCKWVSLLRYQTVKMTLTK